MKRSFIFRGLVVLMINAQAVLPCACYGAPERETLSPAIAISGNALAEFFSRGGGIVVPAHGDRRGHPILFASHFCEEVLSRYDSVGLHGLLDAHPEEVFKVPVSTASILEDMDTPEDYERQKSRISGR